MRSQTSEAEQESPSSDDVQLEEAVTAGAVCLSAAGPGPPRPGWILVNPASLVMHSLDAKEATDTRCGLRAPADPWLEYVSTGTAPFAKCHRTKCWPAAVN